MGDRIRLTREGEAGRNGGPPGDLYVDIAVKDHPIFTREGQNLSCEVPVSFATAVLGGTVDVPTLDGATVKLRLRPGTQSGSRHRVKGKGVVTPKHEGDLIVTVDVVVPTHLTAEQRSAIEALAAASGRAGSAAGQHTGDAAGERV